MKRLLLIFLLLLSLSAYPQTIHFMLFAATNDAELGTAAENVKKYFEYTFVPSLKKNSGMSVDAKYYCGNDFTKSKLESVLSALQTNSNDVIFFYFYGHGFNDCRSNCPNPNNYPTVTLGVNDGPINPRMKSEFDIFNTLKNKNHKLLITIAECCNRCMGGSCSPVPEVSPNPAVDLSAQKIRQLFSSTGDYIVSSSSKGEYSFSGNMGFFASGFKSAFEEEVSSYNSNPPSWASIFTKASSKTTATASRHEVDGVKCVQHPQWKQGSLTTPSSQTTKPTPTPKSTTNHEYVDLGLPSGTLWATCNIGANNPWEYGDYFAWGETDTKEKYDWSTYKYANGASNKLTKYCTSTLVGNNGFKDNKTTLELYDDAAYTNWGSDWRMPTQMEFQELYDNCTIEWTTNYLNSGKAGQIFRSKRNGNIIFFPAAGWCYGTGNYGDSTGFYWSSTLYGGNPNLVFILNFNPNLIWVGNRSNREGGNPIRAIRNKKKTENSPTSRTSQVGFTNGHEYVDLGLPSGTLWATCNIGANNPWEYGDYFAWGETKPKSNYNWATYKYAKSTSDKLLKYCTESTRGKMDMLTNLELSDDAAYVNWGKDWRMPTQEEFQELYENCTYEWVSNYNGFSIKGCVLKSLHNGNTIFFPYAGLRRDRNRLFFKESRFFYWSSSLHKLSCNAYYFFYNVYIDPKDYGYRYLGFTIRPVKCKK